VGRIVHVLGVWRVAPVASRDAGLLHAATVSGRFFR
jgi:hypothetical protein